MDENLAEWKHLSVELKCLINRIKRSAIYIGRLVRSYSTRIASLLGRITYGVLDGQNISIFKRPSLQSPNSAASTNHGRHSLLISVSIRRFFVLHVLPKIKHAGLSGVDGPYFRFATVLFCSLKNFSSSAYSGWPENFFFCSQSQKKGGGMDVTSKFLIFPLDHHSLVK